MDMADSGFDRHNETINDRSIVDEDWYAAELDGRRFVDCWFNRVDLTEAHGRGAEFVRCRFSNCKFNVSEHRHSAFLVCRFQRCSFFSAVFDGCKMSGSTLTDCDLLPVSIRGGRWNGVILRAAELAGINMTGCDLSDADLSESDLTGADLTDTDLSHATIRNTVLTDSHLVGATIDGVDLTAAILGNTHVDIAGAISVAAAYGAVLD